MGARINRNDIPQVMARIERDVTKIINKAAFDVAANAKVAIQTGSKTGKVYNIKKTKRRDGQKLKRARKIVHQASASGEAPANLFGGLANGIMVVSVLGGRLRRRIISTQAYSRRLEFGLNRPFLRPALMKVRPVYMKAITEVMKRV